MQSNQITLLYILNRYSVTIPEHIFKVTLPTHIISILISQINSSCASSGRPWRVSEQIYVCRSCLRPSQTFGCDWLTLPGTLKYVPMRLNPRLNKESETWSLTFPSQVVGRCRDTICDVWGAKEDAGSLAARTATPRACCSSGHISFTL